MALTTVEYSSYFHYDEATKQIKFTDSTDYVSQGTTTANVVVTAKVEGPSGVFYNNLGNTGDPDIDPDVSLDSVKLIALPLDGSGLPEQGTYTITLEYYDSVVGPTTVTDTKTFTLNYTSPTIDISMTVDCVTPLLTATDDTAYTVNNVTPSIVRDFKIHYPPSIPTADVTGTAASINTSVFYTVADSTVEHSSSLTSTLTYLFSADNLIYVIDEVTGSEVVQVACNGDICDIYCCIRSQYNRWQDAKSTNSVLAQKEYDKFEKVIALASLVGNAVKCGKNDHISAYVSEILSIADCDAGCSCDDGTPQLVTGLAINGNTVVVQSGTGTNVTSVTGGGVTTYTVNLSSVNINKLAATYNRALSAGTNVTSITEVSSTVGDVTTKTSTINVDSMYNEELLVRVGFTMNSAAVPTIAITNQKEYGSTFGTVNQTGGTEFVLNNKDTSYAEWTTNYTDFTVGNFFAAGSVDYWPEVKIVNVSSILDTNNPITNLDVEIVSMSAAEFALRFIDKDGAPVNGLFVQDYTSFDLIFKINA